MTRSVNHCSLKLLDFNAVANPHRSSKDINDIGPHPDDEEFDTSAQSAAIDSLSELSDGTLDQYMPQAESLKDKKLQRIAEQMRLGLQIQRMVGHRIQNEKYQRWNQLNPLLQNQVMYPTKEMDRIYRQWVTN